MVITVYKGYIIIIKGVHYDLLHVHVHEVAALEEEGGGEGGVGALYVRHHPSFLHLGPGQVKKRGREGAGGGGRRKDTVYV